jgi:hypothetical protein
MSNSKAENQLALPISSHLAFGHEACGSFPSFLLRSLDSGSVLPGRMDRAPL